MVIDTVIWFNYCLKCCHVEVLPTIPQSVQEVSFALINDEKFGHFWNKDEIFAEKLLI